MNIKICIHRQPTQRALKSREASRDHEPVGRTRKNSSLLGPHGFRLLSPLLPLIFAHAVPHDRSLSLGFFGAHPFSGGHRKHPETVRFRRHLGQGYNSLRFMQEIKPQDSEWTMLESWLEWGVSKQEIFGETKWLESFLRWILLVKWLAAHESL